MKNLQETNEMLEYQHILRQLMIYLQSPDIRYPFTFGNPDDKVYQGLLRHMEKNPYKGITMYTIVKAILTTHDGWVNFKQGLFGK